MLGIRYPACELLEFLEDGVERRKFTIGEVKRICSFPDDFVLVGSYSQQWERLGNSVPPVMAFHVGKAVMNGVFSKINGQPFEN